MMKPLLLFASLLFSCSTNAQFSSLFNAPSGSFMEDIAFADSNRLMVTGSNLYLTSLDGGRNFTGLSSGGMNVKAAHFPGKGFGIAVGLSGLYRINRECTYFWGWGSNRFIGVNSSLMDVHFSDLMHGFVGGTGGALLYTNDQCTSWTTVATGSTNAINGVWCINNLTAFACSDGGIVLKITDGTVTSNSVINAAINFRKIAFINSTTGFVIGSAGAVYKTTDAGATWNPLSIPTTENLLSLEFTNPAHGVVTGTGGKRFVTNDGGDSWTMGSSVMTNEVRSVGFKNDLEGYAVGADFVEYTKDGGYNWTRINGTMQKAHFPTADRGYAVGYFGVAHKTTDGGSTWKPMFLNTIQYLNDVHFINRDTGYVVGGSSVFRTHDGGETWNPITNPSTSSLYSVHFTDYNHGVATGYRRNIIYTANGGATWTLSQNSSSTVYYMDIVFPTSQIGYFCSSDGAVYKTVNGGQNWNPTSGGTGLSSALNNIYFTNELTGWAVGASGKIIHTTDGGNSWIPQPSNVTTYLNGIIFFDNNRGVIVGSGTTYLSTNNGGVTWISHTGAPSTDLTDLTFTDSTHIYATGGGSVFGIAPLAAYTQTVPFCQGEAIYLPSRGPDYLPAINKTVIAELTTLADDYSNAIEFGRYAIDSSSALNTTLPATITEGLYKYHLRDSADASIVSFDRFINISSVPTVSYNIQGNHLVAASNQEGTFSWYFRPVNSSFAFFSTGDSILVTEAGDYYVVVLTGCCQATSSAESIALCNGQIISSAYQNPRSICSGASVTVGNNSYTEAGVYSDTLITIAGCDSIVATTISIEEAPFLEQSVSICQGETITVGATEYSEPGDYTTIINTPADCDSTVLTHLSFFDPVTIEQTFTICEGDTVFVPPYFYTESGDYIDIFTGSQSCDSTVITHLTVLSGPDVDLGSDSTYCAGQSVTLDAGTGITSYLWSNGSPNQTIVVTETGIYGVEVVAENECSAVDSVLVNFEICTLVNNDFADFNFNVYPNPAVDKFFIESSLTGAECSIFNLMGQLILQIQINNTLEIIELNQIGIFRIVFLKDSVQKQRTIVLY